MIAAEPNTAGQYQPYPEYKDSGVEWLGDIPSHWLTSKMRYMFTFGKGLTITKENLRDEGIPCINYGEVHSKYGFEVDPVKHPLRCVEEDYLKTSSSSVLNVGDFVFADTSEDIDGSGNFTQLTSDVVTFAGYHTIIVRSIDKGSHRFFAYLFDSKEFRTAIRHAVKGVKVFSITQAILRGADIWLPSQDERQRIAAFLDYETARIDRLIAQQHRLIELLKEKRQAVISHAVTKGLNPNAPMKDSGVEWLGQVPEHWALPKLMQACSKIGDGLHGTPEYADGTGFYFVNGNNLNNGIIQLGSTAKEVPEEEFIKQSVTLNHTTVLMSINGTIGNLALYQGELVILGKSAAYINCLPTLMRDFLMYFLRSDEVNHYFDLELTGTTISNLSLNSIRQMKMCVPPLEEQKIISSYCCLNFEKYSQLINRALDAVSLMQERRTALISAAVTGKIDLRDWTPPANEVAA